MYRAWFMAILLLGIAQTTQADMFDDARNAMSINTGRWDARGGSIAGGVGLRTGMQPRAVTLFQAQGSASGGCSAANIVDSLKEGIEEIPTILTNVAQGIIANLPMLALCYGFPTVCQNVQHWQAIANMLIQFKYARCEQMQSAMMYLSQSIAGGEQYKCLQYQVNSLNYPIGRAMDNCMSTVSFLTAPDGSHTTTVNLIADTLRQAGASPGAIQVANGLLGEVTMNVQAGKMGIANQRAPQAVMGRYEFYRNDADQSLQKAIQELRDTKTISDATYQAITVPGQVIPMASLEGLVALERDPIRAQTLREKLATAMALTHLTWECEETRALLATAMDTQSDMTDATRKALETKLKILEQEQQSVFNRVRAVQGHLQPALEAVQQAYAQQLQEAAQRGREAPPPLYLTFPFGRQAPSGYSQ